MPNGWLEMHLRRAPHEGGVYITCKHGGRNDPARALELPHGVVCPSSPLSRSKRGGGWRNHTRIVKTFDFTRIRALMSDEPHAEMKCRLPEADRQELLKSLQARRMIGWDLLGADSENRARRHTCRMPHSQVEPRHAQVIQSPRTMVPDDMDTSRPPRTECPECSGT